MTAFADATEHDAVASIHSIHVLFVVVVVVVVVVAVVVAQTLHAWLHSVYSG